MSHDYIQIPPDSTGKKVRHTTRIDMEVTSLLVDLKLLVRGAPVVGKTSTATAKFLGFDVELGETYIYLKPQTGTFQSGEDITINGIDTATVDSFSAQNTSNVVLVDPNQAHHRMKIDAVGSAFVRYSEGDLGFDAFGHAQFSQTAKVADFIFTYDPHYAEFWDNTLIGGTLTHEPTNSSIVLTTNSTSGSYVARTSHQYFPYNPGEGNELLMSYRMGDTGKTGVVRRWGLFDAEDGLFFELNGSTFSVVQRSSSSGTVVDTKISQTSFNGEGLDSETESTYSIDFSKYNIYWLDYQWLGVGKVRFGTFAPNGKRVTMHTFQNPNQKTEPYMRRGTLPLRIEQFNLAAPVSPSESRLVCAAIVRQNVTTDFPGHSYSTHSNLITISGSTELPLITAKPNLLINGETNRTTMLPRAIEVYVNGDPVEAHMVTNASLTGSTFTKVADSTSAVTFDLDATNVNGGLVQNRFWFDNGINKIDLPEGLETTLKLMADGLTQPTLSLTVKCLEPTGNAIVSVLVRWKEIQ